MKTIKCESYNSRNGYLDYFVNGIYFWAQGEFSRETKKIGGEWKTRLTHFHEGKRGGICKIVSEWE